MTAAARPTGRDHDALGPPRWRGQPGRLEVWYLTATDPATRTGLWLHHEVVAPTDGGAPHPHGWVALFPPDDEPRWRRFGTAPPVAGDVGGGSTRGLPTVAGGPRRDAAAERWFDGGGAVVDARRMAGTTDGASWDLAVEPSGQPPMWTFPAPVWERELLPAAQVLAGAGATVTGTVEVDGLRVDLRDAPAGSARIYGHGNAKRWGWLHADLGGGDLLEVVSAVSTRPGLRMLPPATMLQLRLGARDRPKVSLAPGRVTLALPTWTLRAHFGRRRLRATVELPPERSIAVGYVDPDGATATCTNSECADAEIVLERLAGRRWTTERTWHLDGTAHSEVGLRP
jgi:hypothetical protein